MLIYGVKLKAVVHKSLIFYTMRIITQALMILRDLACFLFLSRSVHHPAGMAELDALIYVILRNQQRNPK